VQSNNIRRRLISRGSKAGEAQWLIPKEVMLKSILRINRKNIRKLSRNYSNRRVRKT
jgi:hypothetical protein